MILDYVLIVPCQMGIAGAALATGIGQCVPQSVDYVFFCLPGEISGSAVLRFL